MQAAQAGCTFSLKQQLVDLQAQVAQQNASVEAERRAQLQSATVKADAAELEVKKLAAQVGAQEELHGEELRHVQVRLTSHCVNSTSLEGVGCVSAHMCFCLQWSESSPWEISLPQHAGTEGWHHT